MINKVCVVVLGLGSILISSASLADSANVTAQSAQVPAVPATVAPAVAQPSAQAPATGAVAQASPVEQEPKKQLLDPPKFEIWAASNGNFFFLDSYSLSVVLAGVSYSVTKDIQIGAIGLYSQAAYKDLINGWALGLMVGPVVNFPFGEDIRNAAFLGARIGLGAKASTGSESESKLLYAFSLGKRFKISDHISYSPEVGVMKILGEVPEVNPIYHVSPVSFSIFF